MKPFDVNFPSQSCPISPDQLSSNTASPLKTTRTAALYIRVSTQEQAELSPESQKRLLLDYAAGHDFFVPEEYIFTESVSGRRADKRPKFQEMIALAKHHAFQVILVWKYSRFARNQEESIVYKNRLKRDGVEVVSISEPSLSGPFGTLIERIIEWMDEYYSIRLSGDVFRGMSERARNGGHQARAPFGYRLSASGGTLVPKEPEAGLVRQIFEEFLEQKKSPRRIAEALNQKGLHTAAGGAFEARSVRYLLSNPAYAGILRWNRRGNIGSENAPEDWIWAEAAFPPLIPRETFFRAQVRLNSFQSRHSRPAGASPSCIVQDDPDTCSRFPETESLSGFSAPIPRTAPAACSRFLKPNFASEVCDFSLVPHSPSSPNRSQNSRHWLSGFVKCSACGRSLAISSHKGSRGQVYRSLQCCGYLKGRCSVSHQISERALYSLIRTALLNESERILPADFPDKQKTGTLPEALLPLCVVPVSRPFSESEGRLIRTFYTSAVYDAELKQVYLTASSASSKDPSL